MLPSFSLVEALRKDLLTAVCNYDATNPWVGCGGEAAAFGEPSGPGAALRTPNFTPSEAPVPVREAWEALRAELFVQSR